MLKGGDMKIAHFTKKEKRINEWIIYEQPLNTHLIHTAVLCEEFMREIGCPATGYVAGLTHDIGKSGQAFQDYMQVIKNGEIYKGAKVNHSSAGAILLQRYITKDITKESTGYGQMAIQMIAEAVFSHHSALPDNISKEGKDGYLSRIQPESIKDIEKEMQEAETYFFSEVIDKQEFENLLKKAFQEIEQLLNRIQKESQDLKEFLYTVGLVEKYLLSALVDSDWLDSFWFEESQGQPYEERIAEEIARRKGRQEIYSTFLGRLENKLSGLGKDAGELNQWRSEISKQCKAAGSRPGGVYTLSCPTGAGKTLASMRFALEHCKRTGKTQIFYIIPYTSVIDQNVESIKNMLKQGENDELVEKSILELHSAKESQKDSAQKEEDKEENESTDFWAKRMAEPIIFTTMVRFLNTFFAKGTKNIRPLHQFRNAVLIFDEIQSLNIRHIALFNGVINFLARVCNCTCILCTATQPLLGDTKAPVYPIKMQENPELVKIPEEAKKVFHRVEAIPLLKSGDGYRAEEIADLLTDKVEEHGNGLLIMNTKTAALKVFEEAEKKIAGEYEILYLSTLLYPKHRKEVILKIKRLLKEKKRFAVVSTQIVEAGVDFDFKCVIRSLAGLDSLAQAAGRCNREGKEPCGIVYIVNPDSKLERTESLKDIEVGKGKAQRIIGEYAAAPERFCSDLLSKEAVEQYFRYYFWERDKEMSYRLKDNNSYSLYDMLADNKELVKFGKMHYQYQPKFLNQAFKEAAENFAAIEQNGQPVFIPRGEGQALWEKFQTVQDGKEYRKLQKQAQQYIVNVSERLMRDAKKEKGVLFWDEKMNLYVVNEMYYHEKKGLVFETGENIPFLDF